MAEKTINGTGRRKTAVARVYLTKGKGMITINHRTLEQYFPYAINVNCKGGGFNAQAEAIRHGISRAFDEMDATNRPVLKANGFLTRDSRMVERKKYGQKKARKRFQFSKR